MDRHRTRFLASLSARLEQERALRESEGEAPPIWRRPAGQSYPVPEPARAELRSPPADFAKPKVPLVDSLTPDERTSPAPVIVTPPPTGRRVLTDEALETSEPEQTSIAAVPWSETGMPKALRDAIASVRRVSHEIDEPPPRGGLIRYRPQPDDDPLDQEVSFARAAADAQPFERHVRHEEPPLAGGIAAERFRRHGLHEEPPALGYLSETQEPSDQAGSPGERRALERDRTDERASLQAPPPLDEEQFDVGADAQLSYRDDATDEPSSDDANSAEDLREAAQDRPPRWRKATQRRHLNLAAFAVATVLVVLAGFGIGIVSGAGELDRWVASLGLRPLADSIVGDARTEPGPSATSREPSSGELARSAEPETSPQLSELETVRVAPLPAPPGMEQPPEPTTDDAPLPPPPSLQPSPPRTTSAMPLPPPPKPALPSSGSGQAAPASDQVAGAVDDAVEDAAAALLEADGAGGPFEPILVKTSALGPRVFVHYAEGAPGGPATALHLVRQLRAAGFNVEGRAVEFPIREHSIRYFFEGDRDEAEALGAELDGQIPGGGEVPVLDFTGYQPKPREGHIELWLAG